MKKLHRYPLVATLACGVALLSACAEEPNTDDELYLPDTELPRSETEPLDRPAAREGRVVMTANFEPAEGRRTAEPVRGTATVLEAEEPNGDYRLAVRIEGLSEGEHAWHIHSAPCGKEAPVVVPFTATKESPGLAQALTPGEGGVAEANVTVPQNKLSLEQLKSGEYSIHVHERGGIDHGSTVACANL